MPDVIEVFGTGATQVEVITTDERIVEIVVPGPAGADGADAGGVPVGGTTGQALVKNSNTDYDTEWADVVASPGGSTTQVQFNDAGAFAGDAGLVYDKTANALTIGAGSLKFTGGTSGTITIQPAAAAGTYALTLPTDDGASGQALLTDGSGVLSWGAVGGTPGGSDTQIQYNSSGAFAGASGITTDGTSLFLGSSSRIRFSTDLNMGRNGANSLRLGLADAASPSAQTLGVQSVATGTTDVAGATFTIAGSRSTGTGAAGTIEFQTASAGTTGSAQNALATVATLGPNTLTGSQAISLLDLAQTWNTSGTPTAIKLNVTDTASNASSLLMDLQTGGTSRFKVSKAGLVTAGDSVGFSPVVLNLRFGSGVGAIIQANGFSLIALSTTGDVCLGNNRLGFASSVTSSADAYITRRAAANLRLGYNDIAAPVAQTLSVQSVVAGTSNTAGANLTITGSQGTGTGAGGDLIVQVAQAGSSGSSQNALTQAFRVHSTKTVTVGAAFTVATLPAAGTQGRRAWVTDATAPTFLGALTGGGAVVCPVFDNGTAWVSG